MENRATFKDMHCYVDTKGIIAKLRLRRRLFQSLVLAALLSVVIFAMPANAALPRRGMVTASALTLRGGPYITSDPIMLLPRGAVVRVMRQSTSDSSWYQVTYGEEMGYVKHEYLTTNVTDADERKSNERATGVVKAQSLNITTVLREGDRGDEVKELQKALKAKGYSITADGIFGRNTTNKLVAFQKATGLADDGVAGPKTIKKLSETGKSSGSKSSKSSSSSTKAKSAELLNWWTDAQYVFKRGSVAKITDVKTGISFKVKRYGGINHADCEPLNADDTKKMKQIYGSWSWDRRAITVEVDGRTIAASMNGMPHMGYSIKNNNFAGHFCIHFYKSRTHSSNRLDTNHQNMVKYAYNNYK